MIRSAAVAALLAAFAFPASAKTFVIPHFLERTGFISSTQYTFDTTLYMTYAPGLAGTAGGPGAHVDLWLFDDFGNPLTNNGVVVCGPCAYDLGAPTRKRGSGSRARCSSPARWKTPIKTGYAIATVSNDDANLAVNASIFNSHTSVSDLEILTERPWIIDAEGPRVLVAPHFYEPAGSINNTQFTFDTTIYATYVGGQAGVPGGTGAAVDLYLYADDGTLLKNNGNDVCGPCTYNLGGGQARKASIKLENVILAQGPFDAASKTGFGVVVVRGNDPDGVALTAIELNSHSSPFDPRDDRGDARSDRLEPARRCPRGRRLRARDDGAAEPQPGQRRIHVRAGARGRGDVRGVRRARAEGPDALERALGAGTQRAAWDGMDDGGARVAPGVYFGKVVSGAGELASKVVVLP
jgi:hypothetical protein